MYNQGNYQQFGQRLSAVPPPPPSQFQQAGPTPYGPPVSVRPSGTLTSSQSYLIPPPPPPQNSIWGQSQQISPPVPTPGHHLFYRVPQPPLHPPPSSTYFTPAPLGPFTPPPPPPSSPPGPPPLPPSSPHPKGSSHVNGSEISVKDTSDFNIMSGIPPPPPRDEKTVRKIEVLCQYIAKNGHEFEEMTCQNEVGNPEFEFLFGGPPGSEAAVSHEYFKWMKKKWVTSKLLQGEHNRDLSLKSSDISHSPAGSDMDMEDDITQPEETDIGKSFGSEQQEPDFISNEVDINAEKHACDLEHISYKHVTDDEQFEKSRSKVGVADSELSLDSNTEQNNINLHKEMNQSEESPFRCIQGYASDNSSENDNDQHFENVSPEAVSPKVKEVKEFKNSSELDKGSGSISMPVVEGSLNLTSKIPKPSTKTEYVENRTDGTTGGKDGGAQKEDNNVKLEIDEFGRMVKKGGSDSDSDDYTARWRGKRGRSRSRSRSPYERRRRSPRRRREKRSRSRSWSPKKRGRSRSPYNRRNRSHLREICHDFRLGRCFRGSTCRYYHEPEKSEESRWHKNRRHYHEVSDRLKYSDKLVPEETEVDYQDVSRSSDRVKEEFVEPPGHSAEVASGHENEHPATETAMPGHIPISGPQLAREYNDMPPASLWNSLPLPPPPPPRPQLGGPLPQYHLSQPPFQTTYPFQPFVTPHGPEITTHLGVYPMNYPILQQPTGPTLINQDNFARISSPNLISSNLGQSFLQNTVAESISDFKQSRISTHYNPYASSFDQPLSTKLSSGVFNQYTPDEGQMGQFAPGDQYDPLFDSIDPSSNKKTDAITANEENEEFGETADAEVGAVENDSPTPSSPVDLRDIAPGDIEIDQVKNSGKTKNSKDSRSMKLFKIALADFVKEVLKPSWRQGNMSKEAFKTIVKKTVDKVSGAMKKHQIPKSQPKINHYIDSSQRKLTKLVMGYVDKYVKV